MFTVVNSSQCEHGLGVRDRWSRVAYRDYVTSLGGKGGGSANEGQDHSQARAGGKELKEGGGKQELRNEMGGQPDSRQDSVPEVSLPKILLLLTADVDDHGDQNSMA